MEKEKFRVSSSAGIISPRIAKIIVFLASNTSAT
jgi:hypothetical protein